MIEPKRTLQPAIKTMLGIGGAAYVFVLYTAVVTVQDYGYAIGFSCMVLSGFSILILIDMGYRLRIEDNGLVMRDWGYQPWTLMKRYDEHSIAFDDIVSMEGAFKGNRTAKSRFMPFEMLIIESKVPDAKDIWIYPDALDKHETNALLWELYERRPDIFPEYVIDYMS